MVFIYLTRKISLTNIKRTTQLGYKELTANIENERERERVYMQIKSEK